MRLASPETLPPPATDAEEIRRRAEEILRRPEFQPPPRSLYQRALDEIGELLGEVIDALVGGTGSALAWVVLTAVVGAIAYLVVRGVQGGRRRRGPSDPTVVVDVDDEIGRPATAWDAEAVRLEREGRWREALRCRYRSLVASLAGNGLVEEVPGRTAGEYRALVGGARPQVARPFGDATELFERAWYGAEETGPDDASTFRAHADRVLEGAR